MSTQERHTVSLRVKAGELLLDGHDVVHVARTLGLSDKTVHKYRVILERDGISGLRDLSLGGRPSLLDDMARGTLVQALARRPADYAIDADRWTIGAVGQLIRRDFGLSFSRVYVRQLIIDLGFADQLRTVQPRTVPGKPSRLDTDGLTWLAKIVNASPRLCGIDADRWTNARLRAAVEARYGVRYSHSHMWKIISDLNLSRLISRARKPCQDT